MLRNFNALRRNISNLGKYYSENLLFIKSIENNLRMSLLHNKATLADSNTQYRLKIASAELINHDVVKYVVELPSKEHILGTKSGQHFWVIDEINGEKVQRKYTPLDLEDHKGTFEMVIKIYRPHTHPDFPNGGVMTPHLERLKAGDYISIQGPIGRCIYNHHGNFDLRYEKTSPTWEKKHVKRLGFVAGGSGMTPFLQIIRTICADPKDETKVDMIYANRTEDDIIYREEFDRLAREHPDKFKMWYTIDKSVKPGWSYDVGFVSKEMFEKHLPPPGEDTIIMVCGPKPMVFKCCFPILTSMGYTKEMIFKY